MFGRRLTIPLAIAASVVVGGTAGALLGVPALSGASSSSTTNATSPSGPATKVRTEGPSALLDAAAKALGMTTDDLRSALRGGKSIADVAKSKNIDVNKVIDALVADAQAQIDQAKTNGKLTPQQADHLKSTLKDRITQLVNGQFPGPGAGPGWAHGSWKHLGP